MPRSKQSKYNTVKQSELVQEIGYREVSNYIGNWNSKFFTNPGHLVLELACGYGEYACGLAKINPDKNYLGIDIKGDRLWKGIQEASEFELNNLAFVRTNIAWLESVFEFGEVSEIWLIHPDPRPKNIKQRLCNPKFLELYHKLLGVGQKLYLRTDNTDLFKYFLEVVLYNPSWDLQYFSFDWYNSNRFDCKTNFVTRYEKQFSQETIKFAEITKIAS
jgi:tRNA (guanine-N7-)-methyltransferase